MAMLKLRDGRELEVAETVAEVMGAKAEGDSPVVAAAITALPADKTVPEGAVTNSKTVKTGTLVALHEIRTTVKRKFPTPVDTKAEFEHQVIEHMVNLDHVIDMQPTVAEIKLAPVHDRRQADMPAVSGPFKHDYDQHAFDYEASKLDSFQGEARKVQAQVVKTHTAEENADGCAADLSEVGPYPVQKSVLTLDDACKAADPHGVKTSVDTDDVQ